MFLILNSQGIKLTNLYLTFFVLSIRLVLSKWNFAPIGISLFIIVSLSSYFIIVIALSIIKIMVVNAFTCIIPFLH